MWNTSNAIFVFYRVLIFSVKCRVLYCPCKVSTTEAILKCKSRIEVEVWQNNLKIHD